MLNLILSLLLVVLQIFQTILTLLTLVILVIALFAYVTKPTDESFKIFIKHEINKKTQSRFITNLVKRSFDKEVKDYVFFKIGTLNNIYNGYQEELIYLGIFQNWIKIE